MKMRMAMATLALVIGPFTLTACGVQESPASPTPSATTKTTPSPTTPATISSAEDLVGDWEDVDAKWTVHFKDDGTYVEDFEGINGFRVGKFTIEGDEVALIGDDGNTDKGSVEGQSLKFNLGTLTRK